MPIFRREDPGAVLFAEWSACQNQDLHYSNGDSWDRMLQQGIMLLTRFCQDDRIQVRQPRRNLQIKFTRPVADKNDFVAYIDAIGKLDGTRCLLEWKTSFEPLPGRTRRTAGSGSAAGLLLLDDWALPKSPRSCSSASAWSRFSTCAPPSPTNSARSSATWSKSTIRRIESAEFLPHSGIRFPQNPCSTCPYRGPLSGKAGNGRCHLVRRPGAENLGWLDELNY